MTFDLAPVINQIRKMIDDLEPGAFRTGDDALINAWNQHNSKAVDLSGRLATAKSTFLLPAPQEHFSGRRQLPPAIDAYTVGATDGSFILPSRHSPARFYLLNTGRVLLRYGDQPYARLDSIPELKYRDDDLVIGSPIHRIPISGATIGPRRAAEELRIAADLLEESERPAVALQDGTLILWNLETLPEPVTEWALPPFIEAMRDFRRKNIPVASYVSAPGSREIVNLMRIAVCDYPTERNEPVNCDHCRNRIRTEPDHTPACDIIPEVTDRYFFERIEPLDTGERSAIFSSTSKILDRYVVLGDDELRIDYFYMNVGHEIGRVEVPRWVSRDDELLDLVHWVIFDQCQRGRGYPVVLQEAHEKAVLSTSDRMMIELAIERELARHGHVLTHTGKDGSKRGRYV